jgi:hemolysin activation/secretion protein
MNKILLSIFLSQFSQLAIKCKRNFQQTFFLITCLSSFSLTTLAGFAQTNSFRERAPLRVRPPSEPVPEPETLPPPEDLLSPLVVPNGNVPQPELDIPGTIVVKQFKVVGSTVFSESELTQLLEPYTNRPISFAELMQAQEAINKLYIDNGYITSGTFIPPQTLTEGIVTIEVVEGSVEKIEVKGLQRLRTGYITSRLEDATQAPLNQDKLLEALQLLQLNPLIDKLSAELSTGTSPGKDILKLEVSEASAFAATLRFDNERVPSVGTDRRLIELTHSNLLGFGDRLNARYYNTDGTNALDDLSYTIPINPANGTLGFTYRLIDSEVIEEPFDELDLESDFRQYSFTYRQPIIQTPSEDLALGLTFDRQTSDINLLDNLLEGETRISALRFFQEYSQRSTQDVLALRSQFSFGLEGFQTTLNADKRDEGFFVWRGQAQYVRLLTRDTTLLLRSDIQLADRPLIPLEQFSLGGAFTVRGYRQDLLLADNGLFASAEIRTPILKIPEWQTTLQLTPFVDVGTTWNSDELPVIPRQTLYSAGLGLRLDVGENFNARIDWGIPLADVNIDKDTLQENGVYFAIEYKQRF